MRWSWKIGEFAGIGVYMHATFLLLIGWIALSYWIQQRSMAAVLGGVGFILALFACVVMHEYGHALTARKYGIKTRDITLLPIGGVARLERMPDNPVQELWVALAGPAVNVVIAVVLFAWLAISASLVPIETLGVTSGSFLERLMVVNLFLVGFNLIPAFPMDGGRVLRALLAMRMEYTQATQIAASVGQGLALMFGFLGFFYNPFLLFIAFFVWIGAAGEAQMVQMRSALAGIPVSRAMLTDFRTLSPRDSLAQAAEAVRSGFQQDFPVTENGRVVGVLTHRELISELVSKGPDALVEEVMRRDFQTADSYDMLEVAFARLQSCQCHTLPVLHGGQLVGLLTMDSVGEFMRIESAMKAAQRFTQSSK